jgi:hypothetical protein
LPTQKAVLVVRLATLALPPVVRLALALARLATPALPLVVQLEMARLAKAALLLVVQLEMARLAKAALPPVVLAAEPAPPRRAASASRPKTRSPSRRVMPPTSR